MELSQQAESLFISTSALWLQVAEVAVAGLSFTTNLSRLDQNCIQLMSVGGLDTSKGSSPTSSLQGQLPRALVKEDDLVSYKENICWGIML